MKLMVLTCAVFPSEEEARRKLWIFLRSCERFGVGPDVLRLYGVGRTFPGYRCMKLDWQLAYLQEHAEDFTHVLYTDSWDAFFVAPLGEIVEKYESLGAPAILACASAGLANVSNEEERYPGCFDPSFTFRYPHVGGYITEIPAIVGAFERMLAPGAPLTGDDCFEWYRGWQEGWFRPQLDTACEIFQEGGQYVEIVEGRVRNSTTGSQPCLLHLSGGYTDQVTGKDDRMIPWARRLGIVGPEEERP